MRASTISAIAVAIVAFAGLASGPAAAGGRANPDGLGLYSPDPASGAYRYDPRSWYYRQRGHYPFYGSSYWVPRADMRYRYRRHYFGPRYRYYPAWGYPLADYYGGGDRHW